MEKIWKHDKIAYGGDYNPEQWPRQVWEEDMRLFKLAHIDTVTLNVFSWATLQPSEDTYDFTKLDEIVQMAEKNGLKICMATSTGAHPAWMAKRYPEILRVDFQGRKRKFGGRHNSCPNSPVYRNYSQKLAQKLAEHYQGCKNIIGWHISNEYGGDCYCENCEKAFQNWLKERYGTVKELNRAWNTTFWGHTFYDFDEVVLPNELSEHFSAYGKDRTQFQGITIDYRRFMSDSILSCYRLEYDALRTHSDAPITTNLMGFFYTLDYQKWAKYMDFISWDHYPSVDDSAAAKALSHDLMRGIKGGKSFCLMEQTPSVTNWQPYNKLKRPGQMRLLSYQAVAHGADTVMFFQMRRSIGACEKYHGAVIDHAGHENTRVFREIRALGQELEKIGDRILGARMQARVAIVFDWENWWGISYSAGPSILIDYQQEVLRYYEALHRKNIACDIIGVSDSLSDYDIVIAPVLYMVKENYDEKIKKYVKDGGCFVTTYFSGYVDESDLVSGAYPGKLRDLLGIWVEESDALPEGECNHFIYEDQTYPANILCDIMHTEGAKPLASYQEDFYKNTPVVTEHAYGDGTAYYVGTSSDSAFYDAFIKTVCKKTGVVGEHDASGGVEITRRYTGEKAYLFLLNHTDEKQVVKAEKSAENILTDKHVEKGDCIELLPYDVVILEEVL